MLNTVLIGTIVQFQLGTSSEISSIRLCHKIPHVQMLFRILTIRESI
uniref:Uncharacterized protein n=1 Tax=Anguilla anguilla TaxID=7936 RepID=A0A0E9WBQ2_ANGAN